MLNSLSPFNLNEQPIVENLKTALKSDKLTPCASSAPSSTGFISPLNNGELVHSSTKVKPVATPLLWFKRSNHED